MELFFVDCCILVGFFFLELGGSAACGHLCPVEPGGADRRRRPRLPRRVSGRDVSAASAPVPGEHRPPFRLRAVLARSGQSQVSHSA